VIDPADGARTEHNPETLARSIGAVDIHRAVSLAEVSELVVVSVDYSGSMFLTFDATERDDRGANRRRANFSGRLPSRPTASVS
jgi:Mg-chelatase subunit ChlD